MSHYFDELNQLSSTEFKKLMYGEWVVELTKEEQYLEDAAKEYKRLCDAEWDYRKARADVQARFSLNDQQLHEAIKAYNRRHP